MRIEIYAPNDDITYKYKLYDTLTTVITNNNDNKKVVIFRDMNGCTGDSSNIRKYRDLVNHKNEIRLRHLCESMSLKILNEYFSHKDTHKFM